MLKFRLIAALLGVLLSSFVLASPAVADPNASFTYTTSGGLPNGQCAVPCTVQLTSTSTPADPSPGSQIVKEEWQCDNHIGDPFRADGAGHTWTCTLNQSRLYGILLKVTAADGTFRYQGLQTQPYTHNNVPGTTKVVSSTTIARLPGLLVVYSWRPTVEAAWTSADLHHFGEFQPVKCPSAWAQANNHCLTLGSAPQGKLFVGVQGFAGPNDAPDEVRTTVEVLNNHLPYTYTAFSGKVSLFVGGAAYLLRSDVDLINIKPVRVTNQLLLQELARGSHTWKTVRRVGGTHKRAINYSTGNNPDEVRINLAPIRHALVKAAKQGARFRAVAIHEVRDLHGHLLNPHSLRRRLSYNNVRFLSSRAGARGIPVVRG